MIQCRQKKSDVPKGEKYILCVTVHVGFLAGSTAEIPQDRKETEMNGTQKYTEVKKCCELVVSEQVVLM